MPPVPDPGLSRPGHYTAAQTRVIEAALPLFGTHGVKGTTLQMIADAMGVTKAAVYHQFPAKEDIALAAADEELSQVEDMLDEVEAEPDSDRARVLLIHRMIDQALASRHSMSPILQDRNVVQHFAEDKRFRQVMNRMSRLMTGSTDLESRITTAIVLAVNSGTVTHPMVADITDKDLRTQLLRVATRLLDLPDGQHIV
jgi:AcrR family transcriptional regulator